MKGETERQTHTQRDRCHNLKTFLNIHTRTPVHSYKFNNTHTIGSQSYLISTQIQNNLLHIRSNLHKDTEWNEESSLWM